MMKKANRKKYRTVKSQNLFFWFKSLVFFEVVDFTVLDMLDEYVSILLTF